MSTDWEEIIAANSSDDGRYLRTDEFEDVLASLKLLLDCLEKVSEQPHLWKWSILSAHSALQGACVCILTRTDGGGALSKDSEKLLLEYHNLSTQKAIVKAHNAEWILGKVEYPQKEEIAALPELLRRLPTEIRIDFPHKNQEPKDERTKDFVTLHALRNQFTHFPSVGWSIEIADLPRILRRSVILVEQITQHKDYRRWNRFNDIDVGSVMGRLLVTLDGLDKHD
ncbi:hypothetical protein [Tropicimonas sp. IMCC6043]|uniref:hypothetical protein n=1 Tax=Tropicimonas sp. IMCC6043 TaxID=2510645 RepID=UPI00101D87E9|nr:hypothetical protein [Tropicimonas sp. IMCC6043]RYH06871.1 hypothetical protein EU800_22385 [Tropicimonas sp. IMCC6043]